MTNLRLTFSGPWHPGDQQSVSDALATLLDEHPQDSICCYRRVVKNAVPYAAFINSQGVMRDRTVAYDPTALVENIVNCY